MSTPGRLRTSVAVLTGSALGSRAIGAIASVITARALGPAGRGELALLVVAGWVSGVVLTMGLDLWAARGAALIACPRAARTLLKVHLAIAAGIAAAMACVAAIMSDAAPTTVAAAAVLAWGTAASMVKLGLLQGLGRMHSYAAANLLGSVAYGVLVLVVAGLGRASVEVFLMATSVGMIVTAVWPVPPPDRAVDGASPSYMGALSFGLPGMLGGLVTHALYRADIALVGLWRSAEDAGLYAVAVAAAEVLWVLPNSAAQAIVPRSSDERSTLDVATVSRVLTAVMVVAALLVVVLAPLAVPLIFGDAYEGAVRALPGLAGAAVGIGLWKLVSFHLIAQGDTRTRLVTGLAGLLVMVVLDAWLVPTHGIAGASIGSFVAYWVAAVLCITRWRRGYGARWSEVLLLQRKDLRVLAARRPSARAATTPPLEDESPT